MLQRIQILPPEEARKIAAGEVIDRPAALVREFLDNAIDAGGRLIEVIIDEGGIRRTEVVDDGVGIGKDDLELCCLTHATSKIRSLNDLKTASTLGFRGEALAAAAAVSKLEILSSQDGKEAWKIETGPQENPNLIQSRRAKGTSVRALGLYDTIPARKRFLKRSGSEAAACRQIFNEKALAFPNLSFRFTQDGVLKIFLPPELSLKDRFSKIFLEEQESIFLNEISASGEGFSVSIVSGGPELFRNDRRLQFVFANSRRIQDFSLLQALEYGLQGLFPNGTHPVGAVFVNIDPALADFNIHPAKREARFADPGAIHHAVSSALRNFCHHASMTTNKNTSHLRTEGKGTEAQREDGNELLIENCSESSKQLAIEALISQKPDFISLPDRNIDITSEKAVSYPVSGIKYLGQLFELFILIEKDDRLYIIDQHAAHERILYEKFIHGPIPKQELLVAIPFTTEKSEEDLFLEEKREELAKLGIVVRKEKDEWLIEALPSAWKLTDKKTVEEILNLKNAGENIAERWAATLSCHAAIKDGDYLDEKTSLALAEEALTLSSPRCPHGRPIWVEIKRSELLKTVKRI